MSTSAAQAFAPGSPAGGLSSVAKLASLPSLPAMPAIPSLTQSSSADGRVQAGFDNSGFVVNFGGSASSGATGPLGLGAGAAPPWLWVAGAALLAWGLAKRRKP